MDSAILWYLSRMHDFTPLSAIVGGILIGLACPEIRVFVLAMFGGMYLFSLGTHLNRHTVVNADGD